MREEWISWGRAGLMARRWYRPIALALTVVIGAFATAALAEAVTSEWAARWAFGNGDLNGYLDGARRFLATGSPYLEEQLNPWQLQPHSFIHPPTALPLFLPFLVLPAITWWAIPIVGTAYLIRNVKPWAWPVIALCLAWPRSQGAILAGNSDLWAMLFVALGTRFGWPFVLLLVKPTFLPLSTLGVTDRRMWVGAAIAGALMVPLIPLWFDYIKVIRGAGLPLTYSVLSLPLVAMPLVNLGATKSEGRTIVA